MTDHVVFQFKTNCNVIAKVIGLDLTAKKGEKCSLIEASAEGRVKVVTERGQIGWVPMTSLDPIAPHKSDKLYTKDKSKSKEQGKKLKKEKKSAKKKGDLSISGPVSTSSHALDPSIEPPGTPRALDQSLSSPRSLATSAGLSSPLPASSSAPTALSSTASPGEQPTIDSESVIHRRRQTVERLSVHLTVRPTPQALESKGILGRGSIFGSKKSSSSAKRSAGYSAPIPTCQVYGISLEENCKRDGRPVPILVTSIIEHVEATAMDEEGIFRLSGEATDIPKLESAFSVSAEAAVALVRALPVHSSTSFLKKFLRELPQPLLTTQLHAGWCQVVNLVQDQEEQIIQYSMLVDMLPEAHRATVNVLFPFLYRITQHSATNKMDPTNLSVVFGPTLMRPEHETFETIKFPRAVIEQVIRLTPQIFASQFTTALGSSSSNPSLSGQTPSAAPVSPMHLVLGGVASDQAPSVRPPSPRAGRMLSPRGPPPPRPTGIPPQLPAGFLGGGQQLQSQPPQQQPIAAPIVAPQFRLPPSLPPRPKSPSRHVDDQETTAASEEQSHEVDDILVQQS